MKEIIYLGVGLSICVIVKYLYFETSFGEQNIPKIIIQTWKNKTLPDKCINYVQSVKEKNPDYEYLFFDDEGIESFLKTEYPHYYETYKKLPIKIQKIDFFRYIAVYHFGGFYLDLDMFCLKTFDELLQYEIIFPVDDYIRMNQKNSQRYLPFTRQNQEFLLGQYAFASVPNHPFLLELIESIHKNVNMYVKYVNANTDDYVYQTTGPDFVTQKYIDTKEKDIKILHAKRQYFGNYARHLYMGSWK